MNYPISMLAELINALENAGGVGQDKELDYELEKAWHHLEVMGWVRNSLDGQWQQE